MKTKLYPAVALTLSIFSLTHLTAQSTQPNVLLIMADDLRLNLATYGDSVAITPNIDALAAEGIQFNRAYCQFASCNGSRASMATGLRPDTIGVYHLSNNLPGGNNDPNNPNNPVTLMEHFQDNGYFVQGIGKILHTRGGAQDRDSWSTPPTLNTLSHFRDYINGATTSDKASAERGIIEGVAGQAEDVDGTVVPAASTTPATTDNELISNGTQYIDTRITNAAISRIAQLATAANRDTNPQPFFYAVGFYKPHSPYTAPKEFWDIYTDAAGLDPATASTTPLDIGLLGPGGALSTSGQTSQSGTGIFDENFIRTGELSGYDDLGGIHPSFRPNRPNITDDQRRRLRHGYYAATSYLDSNVGELMQALEDNGVADNTIIVFVSDHGYHLGENNQWAKVTPRDLDAQVPLIVKAPSAVLPTGTTGAADSLVELIDIYPTLVELCALPERNDLDGQSFVRILEDPASSFRAAAQTQMSRPWNQQGPFEMGYTIRMGQFRYTQWVNFSRASGPGSIVFEELYDLDADPFQRTNILNASSTELVTAARRLLSISQNPTWDGFVETYGLTGGTGDTVDFDGDLVSDFAEFALGGDPTDPTDQGLPLRVERDGTSVRFFHPQSNLNDSGVTYVAEFSDDLTDPTSWETAFDSTVAAASADFNYDEVEQTLNNIAADSLFFRLRVTETP